MCRMNSPLQLREVLQLFRAGLHPFLRTRAEALDYRAWRILSQFPAQRPRHPPQLRHGLAKLAEAQGLRAVGQRWRGRGWPVTRMCPLPLHRWATSHAACCGRTNLMVYLVTATVRLLENHLSGGETRDTAVLLTLLRLGPVKQKTTGPQVRLKAAFSSSRFHQTLRTGALHLSFIGSASTLFMNALQVSTWRAASRCQ